MTLPAPIKIISMSRRQLLGVSQEASLSRTSSLRIASGELECWSLILGGLALSYARTGDVSAVAALVRMAAHLRLDGAWLREAQCYLLSQQHSNGSFGLIGPELASIRRHHPPVGPALRLTVEVLWAFSEVIAGRRERLRGRFANHVRVG